MTNADGILHPSNHQARADGYGYAVDSVFQGPDPYLERDPHGARWWAVFCAVIRACGLTSGADFPGLVDQPHAEWPGLPPSKGPVSV